MGILIIILLVLLGPPIIFMVLGKNSKQNKKRAKIFYILGVVYLIIGLGSCGILLSGF